MEQQLQLICDPEAVDAAAKAAQDALVAFHGGPEAARRIGAPGATPAPTANT